MEKKPHLLVLDEINLLHLRHILELDEGMVFLGSLSEETDLVLIGRYEPKKLIYRADFVNEVQDLKHPEQLVTT